MNKIFKDEKIFNNFKKQFRQIFKDESFIEMTKNHFNKNGSFAVFTLALLQNRISENQIIASVRINSLDWVDLFANLYEDENISKAYEQLNLNPLITFENIEKNKIVFENFANIIFNYASEQNWDLNISKSDFAELICNAFIYLMYNSIECKLNWKLEDIISDQQYDSKYVMVLNNTKLFSKAKASILQHCELKINDLIVLLLGGSNHLALNK